MRYHDRVNPIQPQQTIKSEFADVAPDRAVEWKIYGAIFVFALVVRLVYLAQIRAIPFFETLVGDAASYDAWAQRIAGGDWLGSESFYQAPAYPYLLGVLYAIFGHSVLLVRIVQAVFGALACVLIAMAGRQFFDRKTGVIAGVIFSMYGPAIFFDGLIQKASLGLLLLCVLLWRLGSAHQDPRAWRWVTAGLVLGLLSLTRENALILAPVLVLWILIAYRQYPMKLRSIWTAGFVAGLALTLIPVAIRNRTVGGDWAITTVQAGPNFYIGNHEGATGMYTPLVPGHESPPFERADAKRLAEQALGNSLTDGEVSNYWIGRSWEFIRENPGTWLKLTWFKFLLTINAYEISDVEGYNVYRAFSPLLGMLGFVFHFGMLLPAAVLGLWFTAPNFRRHAPLLVVGATLLVSIVAFYILGRYRFPLAPIVCIFAAAGIGHAWTMLKAKRLSPMLAPVLIAAGVALLCNRVVAPERQLNAMAYGNLATVLGQREDIAAAAGVFQIALDEYPESAELNYNMGLCQMMLADWPAAFERFSKAKSIRPDLVEVDYQLGVVCEQLGRIDEALRHYQAAIATDPNDRDAESAIIRLGGAAHE